MHRIEKWREGHPWPFQEVVAVVVAVDDADVDVDAADAFPMVDVPFPWLQVAVEDACHRRQHPQPCQCQVASCEVALPEDPPSADHADLLPWHFHQEGHFPVQSLPRAQAQVQLLLPHQVAVQ